MVNKFLFLLLSLLLSFKAYGTPIYGHDFLGLGNPNYKVAVITESIDANSAIGVFDSTWPDNFGDPYQKVRQILQTGKVKLLRVQLYWSYQHNPAPTYIVKRALPRWEKLALEFPSVQVWLSPSCEYNKTTTVSQVNQWLQVIHSGAPHTHPVLTPMDGPVVPGITVERHGDTVRNAQALSTDGNALFDANAAKLVNDNPSAIYFLGWGPRYNLAESGQSLKPPQRTAAPSFQYIRSISVLFLPKAHAGALAYPQLYKTHAEDTPGEGERRSNRPLLILKEKLPSVQILDSHNTVLGKFVYYSNYLNQGYRYYSGYKDGIGMYGFEIGALAKRNTGSDDIKVKAGNHVYDIGSGAFRTPYYQQ